MPALSLTLLTALALGAPENRPSLSTTRPSHVHKLRGGRRGKSVELPWWASHNNEASGLFNNLRTPAALVAGAVISATFVLEPKPSELPKIVLAKKLHLFIGVLSLCCELLTIVSSTAAIQKLAQAPQKSASVNSLLLNPEYEMYWVTCSANFLLGLLGMTCMLGIRVWVNYGSQLLTQTASLVIIATILMMLSFFSDEAGGFGRTTWRLPFSIRSVLHTAARSVRSVFRRPRRPNLKVPRFPLRLWRGKAAEEGNSQAAQEQEEADDEELPPEEAPPEIDWIPSGILIGKYFYLLWDRAVSGSFCTLLSLLCIAYAAVLYLLRPV
mmetsp:Transcript_12407/g.35725  ORF Transcript_12407/g.35725 Transcript_12407/m.35725 type:complete len:326 (+) Transcript_12407:88-1065(+)